MDLSIESGLRSDSNRRIVSVATSRGEAAVTVNVETILRQVLIPANSFRQGEHINVRGGGFAIANGGNITAVQWWARFGSAGLASPSFINPIIFAPAGSLVNWFLDYTLTHDVGVPDFMGIGGQFNFNDGVVFPRVDRGELTVNFMVDNILYLTARITGTGVNHSVTNETFQVTKVPSQIF